MTSRRTQNTRSGARRLQSDTHSRSNSRNQRRTGELQVDPRWVGLVIGRQGATVISLAKAAGNGCRIEHDRSNKGLFKISAWDSSAVTRAKLAITALIKKRQTEESAQQRLTKQTKKTKQTKQTSHNGFGALDDSDSDEETEEMDTKPFPTTMDMGAGKSASLVQKAPLEDFFAGKPSKKSKKSKTQRQCQDMTKQLFRGDCGRGKELDAERKAYGRDKYQFMKKLEAEWKQGKKDMKWEDYKWEKLGQWNKARTEAMQEKADKAARQADEAAKPKPQRQLESLPTDSFPEFGKPLSQSEPQLGAWAQTETPDWSQAVEKPEATTVPELVDLGAPEPEPEPETEVTKPPTPKAKKFKSLNVQLKAPPKATVLPTVSKTETQGDGAWSDDEDDEYQYTVYPEEYDDDDFDEDASPTKTRTLLPPPPGSFSLADGEWDETEWA